MFNYFVLSQSTHHLVLSPDGHNPTGDGGNNRTDRMPLNRGQGRISKFPDCELHQSALKSLHTVYLIPHPYSDIQQELSSGSMQDLHQVSDALFPDIEGMLPGRTGHNVLTIAGETTTLPRSPEKQHKYKTLKSGNVTTI